MRGSGIPVAARPLTPGEWRGLSAGLETALAAAGATPRIVGRPHPAARIAAAWRGSVPILARGDAIFWPGAPEELSGTAMATLQHELQHVLDYRIGRLTAARYLIDPREWVYDVAIDGAAAFDRLGAEQRATLAEHLWLSENGYRPASEIAALRAVVPWAAQAGGSLVLGAHDAA